MLSRRNVLKISAGAIIAWLLGGCKRGNEEAPPTPKLTLIDEIAQETETSVVATTTATAAPTATSAPTTTAIPVMASEVMIPNIEMHIFKTTLVKRDYKLFVALPTSYETSNKAYPVLYVLDSNALFVMTAEIAGWLSIQGLLPELIVVGIAYNVETAEAWNPLRIRDYTPTYYNPDVGVPGGLRFPTSGGAATFLRIIREEIKPFIQKLYRVDPLDAAIHGHSAGGLFALYTLFHHRDTFNRYIASSPSIWWDNGVTYKYESEYAKEHDDLPAKVYMAIGGLEGPGVSDVHTLTQVLQDRRYANLEVNSTIFDDEVHNSVIPAVITRGLRMVFNEEHLSRSSGPLMNRLFGHSSNPYN